jgi:hypothetical protein
MRFKKKLFTLRNIKTDKYALWTKQDLLIVKAGVIN